MSDSFNFMEEGDEHICKIIYQNLDYNQHQFHLCELESPFQYSFYQRQDNSQVRSLNLNESNLKTNAEPVQVVEVIPSVKNENIKKRADGKSKNFQQNLASFCMTNTPKILSERAKTKKPSKKDIRELKTKLDSFLNENKVKNSQLILLFIYLFFKFESADQTQLRKMKQELFSYLGKRNKEADAQNQEQKDKLKRKILINRTLVEKYFAAEEQQIEAKWVKEICGQLFTGRQKETIDKPLNRLIILQNDLSKAQDQKTQYQIIQSFFE